MCGATFFWKCQQNGGQVWFQMPGYIVVIELRELVMCSLRALGTLRDVRQVRGRVALSSRVSAAGGPGHNGVRGSPVRKSSGVGRCRAWQRERAGMGELEEQNINNTYV